MIATTRHTGSARWIYAGLLFILPLALSGLFGTSTDLLPKRLVLYAFTLGISIIWLWHTLRQPSRQTSPLILPAVGYVFWNVCSIAWATNPFSGWVETLQLIACLLLFLAFIHQSLDLHLLARGAALGGFIVSLIGIVQYLGIGFYNLPSVGLPSSTFIFRNLAAAYLLGCIPLALLALLKSNRTVETVSWLLALSAMLLYLFYTRTRGAWIGLAGGLLVLLVTWLIFPRLRDTMVDLLRQRLSQHATRWSAIACAVLLIVGFLQPAQTSKQVIQQFDEQKATPAAAAASLLSAGSDRGRFAMWRHTLQMIADHPVLGVGLDNWEFIYPLYDKGDKITADSEPVRPHNDFLWITAELGLIGLGLYLYLLARAFQLAIGHIKRGNPDTQTHALIALLGLSCLLIYSLFSFPKEQPASAVLFWIHLAILGGLSSKIVKRPASPIIPALGILFSLCACYIVIQHIAFDQHYHRARAYAGMRRWSDAHREITQALEAGTFDHRARFLKGQYLQKQGNPQAAAQAYREALTFHPNYAHTHHNLGGVYAAMGNQRQAIESFQNALKIRPSYYQARINLGNAYVATGQIERAATAYERALKTNRNAAEAHANLGAIYLQRNQFERAIAALQEAIRLQPTNAQAHNNLAYAYEQTGRIPEAIAAYENLVKHWRGDSAYRETIQQHLVDLRQSLRQPE